MVICKTQLTLTEIYFTALCFSTYFQHCGPVHTRPRCRLRERRRSSIRSKIIRSTFLCGVQVSLLCNISWCSVGRPSLLAVPEVTIRSVTPISAAFALAVFRVKRAVNPSEEASGSYHHPQMLLSCQHEHARPFSA